MNKTLIVVLGAVVIIGAGMWYWNMQPEIILEQPATTTPPVTTKPPVVEVTTHTYRDALLGFSLTLPTALASTTSEDLFRVDTLYAYTAMGPGKSIPGTSFTIPGKTASGTNLSRDSYISIEHLQNEDLCEATSFTSVNGVRAQTLYEGVRTYSFASTTDAGAGNRYEEYIYAIEGSKPCMGIRYFIHYSAIENFPAGVIKGFDKTALLNVFDQIRKTLELSI